MGLKLSGHKKEIADHHDQMARYHNKLTKSSVDSDKKSPTSFSGNHYKKVGQNVVFTNAYKKELVFQAERAKFKNSLTGSEHGFDEKKYRADKDYNEYDLNIDKNIYDFHRRMAEQAGKEGNQRKAKKHHKLAATAAIAFDMPKRIVNKHQKAAGLVKQDKDIEIKIKPNILIKGGKK
jgi:hypothetical protein